MPLTPAPEAVFTMAPPPCLSSKGISDFMHRNTLRRFTRTIRSHSSSPICRDRLFNAGVVEGKVQAAESFHRLVQRGVHVLGPRDVASYSERLPPRPV